MRHEVVAPTVVGIDVGGAAKGFHAVALRDTQIVGCTRSTAAEDIARWCLLHRARAVGVDAPCRWSDAGRARPAERELVREKIYAFATPSREAATGNAFYRWMMNGAALYRELEKHFVLFDGQANGKAVCLETFPQAVACMLAGRILSARTKCTDRRNVLQAAGVDTSPLSNIDYIDAALCAVAAQHVRIGMFKSYGERASGFIFTPTTHTVSQQPASSVSPSPTRATRTRRDP